MILLSPVCVFLAAIIFGEINGFFNNKKKGNLSRFPKSLTSHVLSLKS